MDDFRCFLSSSNGPPQPPNTNNSHNSRGNDNYGSHYNSGNNEEGKLNRDNSNLDSPYQSKGSLSDKLKCHCQIPAIKRKVLKPGNNCGRDFFVCSKMQNDPKKCDYYKWADEIDGNDDFQPSNNTQRRKEIPKTSQRKCNGDAPNCECGIAGVSKIVKKEGPNCGKEFYVCSKGSTDTSRCNFFTWATTAGDLVANFKEYEAASSSVSDKNEAKCNCGLFAVKKTAKTGANPNKEFYTCAKSAGKCKYFQWVTDGDDLQGQSNFHDRGTKYESQYSSNTGKGNTNDTRTCYKCDKIGHFASNCPEGQSSSKSGFACYKCGESGHMAPNCPLAPSDGRNGQSSNASGFTCFKCGEPGHLAPDCGQGPSKGKGGKRGAGGSTRGNTKKSNTKKGGKKANQRQSSMKL